MNDFLLELLCEEIPARMQARARNDLARMFAEEMEKAGLATGTIDVMSTPRRLAMIVREVGDSTQSVREEIKGPRSSAPPQALEGFLRKTGLTQDQLEERDGVYFAVIDRPGQRAADVIAEALPRIFTDFPWPKSMRWGAGSARWVRPLQGIVAILGEELIPVEFAGVAAGATTFGHRFHHPGPITVGGAADYVEKLRACHVIVDQDEREKIIREGAEAAANAASLRLLCDEGLVVENAGLTEWPVPLLGRFDAEYLDVPREVIVLTMRTNQKYFAVTDDAGVLAPAFVCVANIDATDGGEAIVEGNKRVLAARLADARFFWEQDLKVPLEEQAKKLGGIVFHEKLGTVADKVERVAKLARWLVEEGVVRSLPRHSRESGNPALVEGNGTPASAGVTKEELADQAERAARFAKADLVTGMVGEFPELQGVIGGYIAERQGEPREVAEAVRDHYKPVGQGDEVPTAPATVAVSLADKLDTLFEFFHENMPPTGSKDPFALRRAMLGVISIILGNSLRLKPIELFDKRHGNTMRAVLAGGQLGAFMADRLKVQQRDAGVRHDIIEAVFARSSDDGAIVGADVDLVASLARVTALQRFVETVEGSDLHVAYKRAANILKKEEGSWTPNQSGDADVLPEEAALTAALDDAGPRASEAVANEDFEAAMSALASLRQPIDSFFDKVTVNADDPAIRARRLNLLARFRDAVHSVADFSKIEG